MANFCLIGVPEETYTQNINIPNKYSIKKLSVLLKVKFKDHETKLIGMLDTGCSQTIIQESYADLKNAKISPKPTKVYQLDGTTHLFNQYHDDLQISFANIMTPEEFSPWYPSGFMWINPIPPKTTSVNFPILLGLSFIFDKLGGLFISRNHVAIFKNNSLTPFLTQINQSTAMRGGTHEQYTKKPEKVKCCKNCKTGRPCNTETSNCLISFSIIREENIYLGKSLSCLNNNIQEIISYLDKQKYLDAHPIKHWDKNSIVCKLDIINPELIIQDKPIKADIKDLEQYDLHIKDLKELGIIRDSNSPHRSAAFIVNKHSEQVRGKTRMVINYKRLNDNTNADSYIIPNQEVLINQIQKARYFSKFDLKSGFWQIKMHKESIPWTAFTVPNGHYEWLVMPFGLKNAPSIFQRKMDNIFKNYRKFVLVYIDDVLVYSHTENDHVRHLKIVLDLIYSNGLILSKSKMSLFKQEISFLGTEISCGKIKLQPHISKKLLEFNLERLETLEGLRKFLGLLNYARKYIKNLGQLTGSLYSKCSLKGERRFNKQDWKNVHQILELVKTLPTLRLPLVTDYLIVRTDGCENGWGATLLAKPDKFSKTEELCRYASGVFKEKGIRTNTDNELLAVVYGINAFEFWLKGKEEFLIETDCEAIVSYMVKLSESPKGSGRKRWLKFRELLIDKALNPVFKHVAGKNNHLADLLSRWNNDKNKFEQFKKEKLQEFHDKVRNKKL